MNSKSNEFGWVWSLLVKESKCLVFLAVEAVWLHCFVLFWRVSMDDLGLPEELLMSKLASFLISCRLGGSFIPTFCFCFSCFVSVPSMKSYMSSLSSKLSSAADDRLLDKLLLWDFSYLLVSMPPFFYNGFSFEATSKSLISPFLTYECLSKSEDF